MQCLIKMLLRKIKEKRKITVENNLKKMQLKKTNESNDLKVKRSRKTQEQEQRCEYIWQ